MMLSAFSTQASKTNKATEMTNSAVGQLANINNVKLPAVYYANRVKALKLVREKKWQAAKPVIESLTHQYTDDGDI